MVSVATRRVLWTQIFFLLTLLPCTIRCFFAAVDRTGTTMFLGASRVLAADGVTWTWQWDDGTDADVLNCGAVGCGLWAVGEPG